MLKRKHAIVAGAVMAALPAITKAAAITYSFDPTFEISTDQGVTFTPITATGTALNPVITIPDADLAGGIAGQVYIQVGEDGLITGVTNTASQSTPAGSQPTSLGLGVFGIGMSNSTKSVAAVDDDANWDAANPGSDTSQINGNYASLTSRGVLDGNGGVKLEQGDAGVNNANGMNVTTTAGKTALGYGANTAAPLLSNLEITVLSKGSTTLSLLADPVNQSYFTTKTVGSSKAAPTYNNAALTGSDTITLGTLTINVGSATSSSTASNKIIALTPAGTPTVYGALLTNGTGANQATFSPNTPNGNNINVTYLGVPGSYLPGFAKNVNNSDSQGSAGAATASVEASGFNPGDLEVYALKLDVGTTRPTAAQDSAIAAAINLDSTGVAASVIAGGPYASLFPTYDIALTGTPDPAPNAVLAFDFSQETAVPGVTVTDIAAVPEPATAAGVLLGASGLLLGRRKRSNASKA